MHSDFSLNTSGAFPFLLLLLSLHDILYFVVSSRSSSAYYTNYYTAVPGVSEYILTCIVWVRVQKSTTESTDTTTICQPCYFCCSFQSIFHTSDQSPSVCQSSTLFSLILFRSFSSSSSVHVTPSLLRGCPPRWSCPAPDALGVCHIIVVELTQSKAKRRSAAARR